MGKLDAVGLGSDGMGKKSEFACTLHKFFAEVDERVLFIMGNIWLITCGNILLITGIHWGGLAC